MGLLGVTRKEYGSSYTDHLFHQYKEYLVGITHISDRRMKCNSFFLTVNTTLIGAIGYLGIENHCAVRQPFVILVAIVGIILCYIWHRLIRSYRDLNRGKFTVLHEIEALLPLRTHGYEWTILGEGNNPDKYLPFTKVELRIPIVFMILHIVVLVATLILLIFGG